MDTPREALRKHGCLFRTAGALWHHHQCYPCGLQREREADAARCEAAVVSGGDFGAEWAPCPMEARDDLLAFSLRSFPPALLATTHLPNAPPTQNTFPDNIWRGVGPAFTFTTLACPDPESNYTMWAQNQKL